MAQFARPDSDLDTSGGWTSTTGGVLYDDIDEDVAGTPDGNQVEVDISYLEADKPFEVGLSNVTDPVSASDHIFRVRAYFAHLVGSAGQDITVLLMEGASVRAQESFALTTSSAVYSRALGAAEANSISNYSNLSLRVVAFAPGVINTQNHIYIDALELEVPTAGFVHLDIDPTGPGLKEVAANSGYYLTLPAGPGLTRVAGLETTGALILGASGEIKVQP